MESENSKKREIGVAVGVEKNKVQRGKEMRGKKYVATITEVSEEKMERRAIKLSS